jgi:hypothetical protein
MEYLVCLSKSYLDHAQQHRDTENQRQQHELAPQQRRDSPQLA